MKTEIIEGNKLIAEFMGWTLDHHPLGGIICKIKFKQYDELLDRFRLRTSMVGYFCTPDDLQFHSSWDWLMPVVEKIERGLEWKYSVETTHLLYGDGYETTIYDSGFATKLEMPEEKIRITSVYKAVVEFVKYHNTKTKP